jgi:hypothetical protein
MVFNARLMMLVNAVTMESPVITVYRMARTPHGDGSDRRFDCFVLQRPRHAAAAPDCSLVGNGQRPPVGLTLVHARPRRPRTPPHRAALERLRTALAAYDDATGCT